MLAFRPVIIEVSHFASLQDGKREVIVVRSDNGQKWFEHTASAMDDATIDSLCGVSGENYSVDSFMYSLFYAPFCITHCNVVYPKTINMPYWLKSHTSVALNQCEHNIVPLQGIFRGAPGPTATKRIEE